MSKVVVLVLLIGVFYLSTLRAGQHWDDDFALYVHHAENIARGVDYSKTGYIYDKQYPWLGPKTFPPVFPLLLAGVYKGFGLNLTAMKVEVVLLFLMALLAAALAFRTELSTKQLMALVALAGFSPYFWDFKEYIVSDLPFLLFVYVSLFLLYRTHEENSSSSYLQAALAGFTTWVAYGTRSIGVCIVAALWLRDGIRLRKISRFSLVVTGVFLLGAGLETRFVHSEASYFDQFVGVPALVPHAIGYLKAFSVLWDNGYSVTVRAAVLALLSALAVVGFVQRLRNKVTMLETFFITYIVIIVIWPATSDRYIVPLIPLYFFYILVGLEVTVARAGAWQRTATVALVAITVALSYAGKYSTLNYASLDGVGNTEARALFEFVRSKTDPNAIFIFRRPRALALFTDRNSAVYHWTPIDNELWSYFCEVHATHIIAGALDDTQLPPGAPRPFFKEFVGRYSDDLQEIYSNAEFKVYRITRRCAPATNVTAAMTELPAPVRQMPPQPAQPN